jgi:hypothetical protein
MVPPHDFKQPSRWLLSSAERHNICEWNSHLWHNVYEISLISDQPFSIFKCVKTDTTGEDATLRQVRLCQVSDEHAQKIMRPGVTVPLDDFKLPSRWYYRSQDGTKY